MLNMITSFLYATLIILTIGTFWAPFLRAADTSAALQAGSAITVATTTELPRAKSAICLVAPQEIDLKEIRKSLETANITAQMTQKLQQLKTTDCAEFFEKFELCLGESESVDALVIIGPFCQVPATKSSRRIVTFLIRSGQKKISVFVVTPDFSLTPTIGQQETEALVKKAENNSKFGLFMTRGKMDNYGDALRYLFTQHFHWTHMVLIKISGPSFNEAVANRTCSALFDRLLSNPLTDSRLYLQTLSWHVDSSSSSAEDDLEKIWLSVSTLFRAIFLCADVVNARRFVTLVAKSDWKDQTYGLIVATSTLEDHDSFIKELSGYTRAKDHLDFVKFVTYDYFVNESCREFKLQEKLRAILDSTSSGDDDKRKAVKALLDQGRCFCAVHGIGEVFEAGKQSGLTVQQLFGELKTKVTPKIELSQGFWILWRPKLILYSHNYKEGRLTVALVVRHDEQKSFVIDRVTDVSWVGNKEKFSDAAYTCNNKSSLIPCKLIDQTKDEGPLTIPHMILIFGGSLVVLVALCLSIFFTVSWYRKRFMLRRWYIKPNELSILPEHTKNSRMTVVGTYNKLKVMIYHVRTNLTSSVLQSKETLKEVASVGFYMESKESNPKIAKLIGYTVMTPGVYSVVYRLSRGFNLSRALKSVKLVSEIKLLLIRDLARSLEAIHGSFLQCHGDLRTDRCIIDERNFVLRIVITKFPKLDALSRKNQPESKHAVLSPEMLWMAPELLRVPNSVPTQEGDVYSFSIIVHEIIFQKGPFYTTAIHGEKHDKRVSLTASHFQRKLTKFSNMEDDESCAMAVLQKMRTGHIRPSIISNEFDGAPQLKPLESLINECWHETPGKRPKASQIVDKLESFSAEGDIGKRLKIISKNFVQDLWAKNKQAIMERDKALKYLTHMMPSKFVYEYVIGQANHNPDYYPNVTIYFNDLLQFANVLDRYKNQCSTEVITILDELFTAYDRIFSFYDVTPLQRVGSSLLLASGVPHKNDKHTSEIAQAALQIRHFAQTYKRQKLNLRAGMHSGDVSAGIVGKKVPQFGLFGDTVNMASRMASAGEINEIQMSEEAQKSLTGMSSMFVITGGEKKQIKGKGERRTFWLKSYGKSAAVPMTGRLDNMPAVDARSTMMARTIMGDQTMA